MDKTDHSSFNKVDFITINWFKICHTLLQNPTFHLLQTPNVMVRETVKCVFLLLWQFSMSTILQEAGQLFMLIQVNLETERFLKKKVPSFTFN